MNEPIIIVIEGDDTLIEGAGSGRSGARRKKAAAKRSAKRAANKRTLRKKSTRKGSRKKAAKKGSRKKTAKKAARVGGRARGNRRIKRT
jgi:hypothetical protein